MLAEAKRAFGSAGLPAGTVSSAGTSTMREALADPAVTEIQAGTYALMEADLDGLGLPFVPALSVVATVISRTHDRAVLDAGRKSIAGDYGPPAPLIPGAEVTAFNEEHTTLRFPDPSAVPPPALGERVALRPAHARLTFNLHDAVWLAYPDGSFERTPVTALPRRMTVVPGGTNSSSVRQKVSNRDGSPPKARRMTLSRFSRSDSPP